MTEFYTPDGKAITNQNGNQPADSGRLQAEASDRMMQNRPGVGQMLSRLSKIQPVTGTAMQGIMDNSAVPQANAPMAQPDIAGTVEFKAGMGAGLQVPANTDAYSLFQPTVLRHGKIDWQNGRPIWKDLDYRNMAPIYGEINPTTRDLQFRIDCPTNSSNGMRRDTITVKHTPNSDGSIQAEMVSTYPYGHFQTAPRANYSGGIQMVREVQPTVPQFQPQQQNSDAIGSVMPGTPMNGGMDPSTMAGNMRTETSMNNGGDQASVIAAQQKQIQELQQQNQAMKNDKGHPIRDVAIMGLGAALQAGSRYLNRGGYGYGGYGNYGRGIPFVNGGGIPFINNNRNRLGRRW